MNSSLTITNCTISHNIGYSGLLVWDSDVTLENSIISFGRSGHAVYYNGGSLTILYSVFYRNDGGDWIGNIENQFGINGNISADPLFLDTLALDFHLQQGSPCIDSGNPESPPDPDGTRSDMGALYFNQVGIGETTTPFDPFSMLQTSPNPFSSVVNISC